MASKDFAQNLQRPCWPLSMRLSHTLLLLALKATMEEAGAYCLSQTRLCVLFSSTIAVNSAQILSQSAVLLPSTTPINCAFEVDGVKPRHIHAAPERVNAVKCGERYQFHCCRRHRVFYWAVVVSTSSSPSTTSEESGGRKLVTASHKRVDSRRLLLLGTHQGISLCCRFFQNLSWAKSSSSSSSNQSRKRLNRLFSRFSRTPSRRFRVKAFTRDRPTR